MRHVMNLIFCVSLISTAAFADDGPTVPGDQMLTAEMSALPALTYQQMRAFFQNNPRIQIDCTRAPALIAPDPQIEKQFSSLIPHDPTVDLRFSIEPRGNGFNILAARGQDAFSSDQHLACNAGDEKYHCQSLQWNASKKVDFALPNAAPQVDVAESFQFFAGMGGDFYAVYDFSVTSYSLDLFKRQQPGWSVQERYLCQRRVVTDLSAPPAQSIDED